MKCNKREIGRMIHRNFEKDGKLSQDPSIPRPIIQLKCSDSLLGMRIRYLKSECQQEIEEISESVLRIRKR